MRRGEMGVWSERQTGPISPLPHLLHLPSYSRVTRSLRSLRSTQDDGRMTEVKSGEKWERRERGRLAASWRIVNLTACHVRPSSLSLPTVHHPSSHLYRPVPARSLRAEVREGVRTVNGEGRETEPDEPRPSPPLPSSHSVSFTSVLRSFVLHLVRLTKWNEWME